MSLRAVVFDFDGTLFLLATDWVALRSQLDERLGLPGTIGEHTARACAAGDVEALALITDAERAGLTGGDWIAGARTVLDTLRRRGIAVAVFSRNSRDVIREALAGLTLGFEPPVCGREDVTRQKPDAEGLRLLLERLAVGPGEALMVGDGAADIEAARAAGVPVAILGRSSGADHHLDALGDLLTLSLVSAGPD